MDKSRFINGTDIRDFDIRDLHDKTLEIKVFENTRYVMLVGKDVKTNNTYVLAEQTK